MRAYIIFLLILVPAAFAQSIGCCCDPVAFTGSLDTSTACAAKGWTFLIPPSPLPTGFSCPVYCNSTLAPPVAGYCGDGICQANENAVSCPQDCVVALVGVCADPLYRDAPVVSVSPVKGELALDVSVSVLCPASHMVIERCEGAACSNFVPVADVPISTSFTDSTILKWDTAYRYRVVVEYSLQGYSDAGFAVANPGDLECWDRGYEEFCIAESAYDAFEDYLKDFGYGIFTPAHFSTPPFADRVVTAFASRFNRAWECDADNVLSATGLVCGLDKVCAATPGGAVCLNKVDCGGFHPFGLFGTTDKCEGFGRYCFFDRSHTVVDYCYNCDPSLECIDYKSEGACTRDNCGLNNCEWHPIVGSVDSGVCVDAAKSNCEFCVVSGTYRAPNKNVTSILEECTESKAAALSTANYPCFFDRIYGTGMDCDSAYCAMYTASQCQSPPGGIKLDDENRVVVRSNDPCGIGVCELLSAGALQVCFKNADGNSGINARDCAPGNVACERDYFPPQTTITTSGVANRVDELNIMVFDKTFKTASSKDVTGDAGYSTHICIVTPNDDCGDPSAFPIVVDADVLLVKNLELKDGQDKVGDLLNGSNTIKFYSRDPANNVEVVKTLSFSACDYCQGPYLLNVSVSDGHFFKGVIYTSSTRPEFLFVFDEAASVVLASLDAMALSPQTSGAQYSHAFSTPSTLSDGEYVLRLNAHNAKNVYMNPSVEIPVIVDTSVPSVTISPADGSSVTGSVNIVLNFSSPSLLNNVSLVYDSFDDPYAAVTETTDMTDEFSTVNHMRYSANVRNLEGGAYSIVVDAEGLNALPVDAVSTFFVAADPGIRLVEPSFGVTPYSTFDVVVLTPVDAECRYLFDVPDAPAVSQFPFLSLMSGAGRTHSVAGLSIQFGDDRAYPLHVLCDFGKLGVRSQSFDIVLDADAPNIVAAYAEPSVIAESFYPNQSIYMTNLKVELDKGGFCKYSGSTSTYDDMLGEFPGLDVVPKQSHTANVTVYSVASYDYFVVCEALNGLRTAPVSVSFYVDTSLGLNVSSATPVGFGSRNVTLGVVANKRVLCYYGDRPAAISEMMGLDALSFTQRESILVPGPGKFSYFVRCVAGTSEKSNVLNITFFVDTTKPNMLYVDDSSTHPDPEISWLTNKVRVSFLGEDGESGVDHYLVSLRERDNPVFLIKDAVSNRTDGKPFFIMSRPDGSVLDLENGSVYFFRVSAVNPVGLVSEVMESDGVRVDVSQTPPMCMDGERDGDETDVDCGGDVCNACSVGQSCSVNSDCNTNYCNVSACAETSCADNIRNGWESDVDCGGQRCAGCVNGLLCVADSDCASNFCSPVTKRCDDAPACMDGLMSEGESDIDCGGPCAPCGDGKSCFSSNDCVSGLVCDNSKVCSSIGVEVPYVPPVEEVRKVPFLLSLFKFLLWLLLVAAVVYACILLWKRFKPKKEAPPVVKKEVVPPKEVELDRLREFAKSEDLESKDWLPLERMIKRRPLPKREFDGALRKLRRLAHKRELDPLKCLREMLEALPSDACKELVNRYRLMRAGVLSKAERDDLLDKLRLTADYYEAHKDELERELMKYGR